MAETAVVLYRVRSFKFLDSIAIFMMVSYITIFIFRFTFLLID